MKCSAYNFLLIRLCTILVSSFVSTGGISQTIYIDTANGTNFKVLYATPQDVIAGKRVAETLCAGCHGINGISKQKDVPHIAGQRPVYLYLEIKAYQKGMRNNTAMTNAVKYTNDDAIMKVSAYYANLEPAEPVKSSSPKTVKPSVITAGKAAATGCSGCHGETGITNTPGMPSLIGMHPKYFIAAIHAYKYGQRKHDMMKDLVSGLSDTDIHNMSLFYALQKPEKAETPIPNDASAVAGKSATAGCAGCHGDTGTNDDPTIPNLAGQDAQYFIDAMRAYKDGTRKDETMKGLADSLDESTIKNLAAYYANQTPQAPKISKPLTVVEWTERCDRCHGVNGNSTDPRLPALAAQQVEYLKKTLQAYKKGERKSKEMVVMSEGLDDALVEDLASYYARQKARGITYLILPPIHPTKSDCIMDKNYE